MKLVLLDAGTLGADLSLDPFRALGDLTVYESTAPEEVAARIAGADVVMQNKTRVTREALSGSGVKIICEAATGYDNIDLAAAREFGVAVCNVPGYSTPSVVQVTAAMVLSLATHLPAFTAHVASGDYTRGGAANKLTPVYHELSGLTWGVVGYGNIGKGVADVARALGCRVLVNRAHADENSVSLETLCRASDVISLHTPLNDSTRGLIGEKEIALMKPGVILVNVARGAVTDEAAVARAVLSGKIGAFGCDVYGREPFGEDHPFHALLGRDNVALTPHMAWGSYEARVRCRDTMVSNIRAFFAGARQNRVD